MTLKSARKYRKLSQEKLAYLSGVSLSMISRLESKQRQPSFRIAMMLSHTLGVRPEEIFPFRPSKR